MKAVSFDAAFFFMTRQFRVYCFLYKGLFSPYADPYLTRCFSVFHIEHLRINSVLTAYH